MILKYLTLQNHINLDLFCQSYLKHTLDQENQQLCKYSFCSLLCVSHLEVNLINIATFSMLKSFESNLNQRFPMAE